MTTKNRFEPPYILFADDDPDTLALFKHYVEDFGWTAEYVSTAREIVSQINIACAAGRCYDALVCDVNYFDERPENGPRISGVAAARAVRKTHPDLPIVFVSGFANYLIKGEVKSIAGEMFEKPVNMEMLFERLSYLVRWTRIAEPPPFKNDRRRTSINQSGYNRRRTDQPTEIPEILSETFAEVREQRRVTRARGDGH